MYASILVNIYIYLPWDIGGANWIQDEPGIFSAFFLLNEERFMYSQNPQNHQVDIHMSEIEWILVGGGHF